MISDNQDIQQPDKSSTGQIVLYQPDDSIKLEVKIDETHDTVWLSTAQIAQLFNREDSVVRRHIINIFKEYELEKDNNVHFLHVNGIKKPVPFYNLDVIMAVGYRVKSKQGILFRRWATNVLRDHLLKGYSINRQLIAMQDYNNERFTQIEQQLNKQQQEVEFLVDMHRIPTERVFPTGCVFDAWEYVSKLIRSAKVRIILIDNYCDERTLTLLSKRADTVECTIHTRYNETFKEDMAKHNRQYPEIKMVQLPHQAHDRFLIIDNDVYIMGDSIKNLGHSLTTVLKTMFQPEDILSKLK